MTDLLWQPSATQIAQTQMYDFMTKQLKLSDYTALYQWSINNPAVFWENVAKFCEVHFTKPYHTVLQTGERMIDAKWFVGGELNFAAHLLRYRDDKLAIIAYDERGKQSTYTYAALYQAVAQCAHGLKQLGVGKNDVVAGFLPNIPETIIAMLAATSLGAIWTACSPDFGEGAVLDRLGQVNPKVIFVVESYVFKGKTIDCEGVVSALRKYIEQATIISITQGDWKIFLDNRASDIEFVSMPFDHPIYILYSSGTTGIPKCIVHGAGGTLLQHLKELMLHTDLRREDILFFYTTCGWMMWHWMVSSLAIGNTLLLYEGAPIYPDEYHLWQIISDEKVSVFGTSAKYIDSLHKSNVQPKQDLTSLRTILSTGSPLLPVDFDYVYQMIKSDLCLSSISGGTDIISCFALGCPILPVYRGEIQCIGLGMAVQVFNEKAEAVLDEKGELVCTAPFPSMPIYFWKDAENARYLHSYFEKYPNVWTHGDFAQMTPHGGVIIYGRSDAVLKRAGVRIGSAEIYRPLSKIDAIVDSLVIGQPWQEDVRILLFVVLREGKVLDNALIQDIIQTIRHEASPRHVPDGIIQVPDLPRTRNNKLSELAVKQVVMGEKVSNQQALANPECLNTIAQEFGIWSENSSKQTSHPIK